MKSHEFARHLMHLAKLLRRGPDIELADATPDLFSTGASIRRDSRTGQFLNRDDIPLALNALLSLSSIDKREWANLIRELNFPIEVTSSQSTRDVVGKLLTFLEHEPAARDILSRRVKSKSARGSPELLRALNALLK